MNKWIAILIILLAIFFLVTACFAKELDWDRLIPAIIQIESGGDPNAVSDRGAIGLMQITPIVLEEYNNWIKGSVVPLWKEKLYEPHINEFIGTWYLHRLKDHYLKDNYTLERLLAAYNGGITRLRKVNYDVKKMPRETRNYVKRILRIMEGI